MTAVVTLTVYTVSQGKEYLERLRSSSVHLEQLVEDILNLSPAAYHPLRKTSVHLSALAASVAAELERAEPGREVEFVIEEGLVADGDPGLLRLVLENLLANAWKYTAKNEERARIEFGAAERGGARAYFVRDDGAGFDMSRAAGLFEPFRRLHRPSEFEGTGIGLTT